MFILIDIASSILTTIIPFLLTIKSLDSSIQLSSDTYRCLLNYWLYYVILQFIQYNLLTNVISTLICSAVKVWLFYSNDNTIGLLNNVIITRIFLDIENFKSYEEKYLLPIFRSIRLNSLTQQLDQLGSIYAKPANYQLRYEGNLIATILEYSLNLVSMFTSIVNNVILAPPRKQQSQEINSQKIRSKTKTSKPRRRGASFSRSVSSQEESVPYPIDDQFQPRSVSDPEMKRRALSSGEYDLDSSIWTFRQDHANYSTSPAPSIRSEGSNGTTHHRTSNHGHFHDSRPRRDHVRVEDIKVSAAAIDKIRYKLSSRRRNELPAAPTPLDRSL
ncbi:uncharacterized protein J8A68_005326 [[Candida] subhashii]|uniref:Uncharacterized protein n=1 Tax=[Candida] subhashii TaxID=561895 RepID=A0A8J5QF56_9ASCO|nr:uncharacterized protein J8A68_005326 [[Candida] subhashii]KAG7661153.1 hypothetical protein J8A68_005326 [[Candida] subhashii]